MELIATLIVFALVFLLLMSWGCGGRMVRGLGDPASEGVDGGTVQVIDRDPVCGMRVGPGGGPVKEVGGRILRFCSQACLVRFEEHPEMYGSDEDDSALERKEK